MKLGTENRIFAFDFKFFTLNLGIENRIFAFDFKISHEILGTENRNFQLDLEKTRKIHLIFKASISTEDLK